MVNIKLLREEPFAKVVLPPDIKRDSIFRYKGKLYKVLEAVYEAQEVGTTFPPEFAYLTLTVVEVPEL